MDGQIWSWVLSAVGLAGFFLAGKKVWWCWYINIFNQILWLAYALVTEQHGFIVASAGYTVVFVQNAISWTKEHKRLVDACHRFHPGEPCKPGSNHPGQAIR